MKNPSDITPPAPPILNLRNLSKRFGAVTALHPISLSIRKGEIFGLLGSNGAGKTTMIGMILGLITPTTGEIRLLGCDMTKNSRAKALARVNFQSPYVELPKRLTLRENLNVFGKLYGVPNMSKRIGELEEEIGLHHFLDRPFGSLSAGQRSIAGLAKALLNKPEILFLDEPTASLDPDMAARAREILMNYRARENASIFLASHNMREVEEMCSDVLLLHQGEIAARGDPRGLITRAGASSLEELFIQIARDQARLESPPRRQAVR